MMEHKQKKFVSPFLKKPTRRRKIRKAQSIGKLYPSHANKKN